MNCSLNTVIGLIVAAMAALAAAIGMAVIFFNLPGVIVAIALVGTVTFVLIPQINSGLQAYATCRGPSKSCNLSFALTINTLGQLAAILSIIAWVVAAILLAGALTLITSVVLAWLGVTVAAAAEILQVSGAVSCGVGILILAGVLTNALGYKSCRDAEGTSPPPPR
jgi:hypothetical protein